jgi:dTDP-glucose 4,6-dehydratase
LGRILVTGSNGFIGSHLVDSLKGEHRVVSLHHNHPLGWQWEALKGSVQVRGDIRDFRLLRRVLARYQIDRVVHLAAIAKVKTAYLDPLSVYDVNVMGTVAVLEACRQLEVERVLVLNTDKVYGEKLGATVDDPYQPSEPYSTSKICQGFIAWSYMDTYGMDVVVPHSCNAFGYDPHSNRIFPNTIKACLRGESPLIFSNDQSIREYIYIEDLVGALKTLLLSPMVSPGLYNISTGWVYNQRDIVLKVLEHFPDLRPKYVHAKLPPQIQKETMKMSRWGWKPEWSFDDAIDYTIAKFEGYRGDWE